MNLTFPLTPETIREGIQETISVIKKESGWDFTRDLSAVTIELGDAPEINPAFGVVRSSDKLIFGNWLNSVTPNYHRLNICEFLITRESFTFFFPKEFLFKYNIELVDYILNIEALSYLRKKYEKKSFELKLSNVLHRFLHREENITDHWKIFLSKIDALLSIVLSQQIEYKLIHETFLHFLDEFNELDFDQEEIIDYLIRYLSNSSEEMIAPIRFRDITLQVMQKIVELGFDSTSIALAENLEIDNSTITRELTKITNRYKAKFRVEKNFYKLGLHYYSIIIRIKTEMEKFLSGIIDELTKIRYIGEIYDGKGNDYLYIYSITLCPHIVADNLGNKLLKFKKQGMLDSYEIKPLKNRLFMTALIEDKFTPTLENYKKLLNNELKCVKLVTWDNNKFKEDVQYNFSRNEKNLLQFISVYQSHILVNPLSYRAFMSQLYEFLEENNIDTNKMDDILGFLNKQRNLLLSNKLIDFRLQLTVSNLAVNDMLMIKVDCDPEDERVKELLLKIAVFSWIAFNIAFESVIIRIQGLNTDSKIVDLITEVISSYGFEYEVFNTKSRVWRFIPYAELYYYDGNKWAIN